MKKKTIKTLLPVFLLAFCFMFTTLPTALPPTSDESEVQIMPLSNMEKKDNSEGV